MAVRQRRWINEDRVDRGGCRTARFLDFSPRDRSEPFAERQRDVLPSVPPQVERELRRVPGVRAANVDYKSGLAKVVADERVKPSDLVRAVNNAGFRAEVEESR
jgi:copper chaperone CopZ